MPLVVRYSSGNRETNSLTGALVLGHSLRDEATTHKLAVLVTSDTVSEDAIAELRVSLRIPSL